MDGEALHGHRDLRVDAIVSLVLKATARCGLVDTLIRKTVIVKLEHKCHYTR